PGTPGEGQGGGRAPIPDPHPSPPPDYRGRETDRLPILNDSLLSLANIRAKAIQRSSIRLHRLNARAWLLITFMLAMNLALISMTSNGASTKARLLADISNNSRPSNQSMDEPLVDLALSTPAHSVMPKDPDDPNASHIGESNSQKPSKEEDHQTSEGANSKTDNERTSGVGTGIATTSEPTPSHPQADQQPEPSNRAATGDGKTATGSGVASTNASPQHQSNHADTNARVASLQAPDSPWQSPSWQSDVSKAQLAVSHDEVPPPYHDLLLAYF